MAADAIHGGIQLLAFADCVGALFVLILRGGWSRSPAGVEIAHRREVQLFGAWRLNSKAALLALATHEGKSETQRENQESRKAGTKELDVPSLSCFPSFLIHFELATCFGGSGKRGTPYSSRMPSISFCLRCRIASTSSCS